MRWRQIVPANVDLTALLSPLTPEQFLGYYERREHLHLSRAFNSCGEVLTVQDVDTLLQNQRLPATMFELCQSGELLPVEEWSRIAGPPHRPERVAITERLLDLFRDGATLVVNGAHHAIPRLAHTCRQLSMDLGFPARANIYI